MYERYKSLYVIEQYAEQVAKQDLTETWIVWNLLSSLYVSVQGDFPLCMAVYRGDFLFVRQCTQPPCLGL